MRRIILLKAILAFIVLPVTTILKAQVTIGSTEPPLSGALLDLKESGETTKGLMLPRVRITDRNDIKTDIPSVPAGKEQDLAGLVVYNHDGCFENGGDGIFIWTGDVWERIPEKEDRPGGLFQPNSYLLAPGATTVEIPVEKAFAIWEYYGSDLGNNRLPAERVTGTLTPVLYWQDAYLIASASSLSISGDTPSDKITVTLIGGATEGNAVIALKDGSGTIRWSWHIWVTDDPTQANLGGNGRIWMDRHLGATSATPTDVEAIGLYYQWGRKDPFPRPTVWDNIEPTLQTGHGELVTAVDLSISTIADSQINLKNTIINPIAFMKMGTSNVDWYNGAKAPGEEDWVFRWSSTEEMCIRKTPTDPCPEGWRVPSYNGYSALDNPFAGLNIIFTMGPFDKGYILTAANGAPGEFGYYPATGARAPAVGSLTNVGISSSVYTTYAGPLTDVSGFAFHYPSFGGGGRGINRLTGASIRCVKE